MRHGHAIIARAMAPIAIDPSTRRNATTWVGRGLLFVAIVFLLEHARPLLLPVTIAIVFTFVLAAPVRALQRAAFTSTSARRSSSARCSASPSCC